MGTLPERSRVSQLLARGAIEELVPLVYDELHRLAAAYMRDERGSHTLQPTALAHEAYLKLVDESEAGWRGRAHFFAAAARAMRQILVDHARARGAAKRGGGRERITLADAAGGPATAPLDLLALDEALADLARLSDRRARLVEMRFFAGLTNEEAAEALGVATATVEKDWYLARAWLRRRLGG